MESKGLGQQANIFLYELNNTQHEYGFSNAEEWTLEFVTLPQKTALEDQFYPTLSIQIGPSELTAFLDLLKTKLNNAVSLLLNQLETNGIQKGAYLVAYNAKRLKY